MAARKIPKVSEHDFEALDKLARSVTPEKLRSSPKPFANASVPADQRRANEDHNRAINAS